jgi:hypothetical protein
MSVVACGIRPLQAPRGRPVRELLVWLSAPELPRPPLLLAVGQLLPFQARVRF